MESAPKTHIGPDRLGGVPQREEQFQRVFTEAPIGMALFDANYRFVRVNRALAQMLDTTEEALVGASCDTVLRPEEAAGQRLLAERLLARQVQGYKLQRCYPVGDRSERFADVTVTRVEGLDGGVLGLEMIADITEARQAKEKNRVHDAELAHATRLAMLGEMVAGIAHEVNQPLAAIVNYANGSTRRVQSGDAAEMPAIREALLRIASEAMRASEIVRRLKSLARKESGQRERQSLEVIAQRTLRLVESEVREKNVAISLDLAPDIPPVLVDPIQIEQIILNLIRNACDAMQDQEGSRGVMIRTFREGDESVALAVADSGPGLSPALLSRVFDAFFTTKRSGLGMGLSISQSIAEAHHGRLWAEPNNPTGTVFTLALPIFGGSEP